MLKKLLLSAAVAIAAFGSASAATETFSTWSNYTWNKSGDNYTAQVGDFTFLLAKGTSSNAPVSPDAASIRIYGGSTLTITAPEGYVMTEVAGLTGSNGKATGTTCSEGWTNETGTITTAADQAFKFTVTGGLNTITFDGDGKQLRVKSVTITYDKDSSATKTNPKLSFPEATYNATLGEAFTAPVLTMVEGAPEATYTSSNEAVATVNSATGEITLVGGGETSITAETAANDNFYAGKASYVLIVKDPNVKNYTLIKDINEIANGDKVVIACNTKAAVMGELSSSYGSKVAGTFTSDYSELEPGEGFKVLTIQKSNDLYLFYDESSAQYLTSTAEKNISYSADKPSTSSLSIGTDSNATIQLGSTSYGTLLYNASSPRFTCYTSKQTAIQLYLVEKAPAAPEVKFDYEGGYSEKVEDNGHTTITVAESTVVKITPVNEGDTVYYSLIDSSDAPAADTYKAYPADGLTFSVGAILYLYTESADGVKSAIEWYAVVVDNSVAVSELNAEAGEAEFFTLQGVRVANPENGLFIKVQNGKAAKVLVK